MSFLTKVIVLYAGQSRRACHYIVISFIFYFHMIGKLRAIMYLNYF